MISKITKLSVLFFSILFLSSTSILAQEQSYDPAKEPQFDKTKMMKDLDKLSLNDSYYYAQELSSTQRYKAAIFALEYTIKKNSKEINKWPNFFGFLGRMHIYIKDFNKAKQLLTLEYQYLYYPKGIPKNKIQNQKYKLGADYHYITTLNNCTFHDNSLSTVVLEYAREFMKRYPNVEKEKKEIEIIIKDYEREFEIQAEYKKEQEKIIKLAQAFLNNIAEFVRNKDIAGLNNYFLENSISDKIANRYSKTNIDLLSHYEKVTFIVTNAAHCFSESTWCVTFKWWTEPRHVLLKENPYMQTFWTMKIINGKLYLAE